MLEICKCCNHQMKEILTDQSVLIFECNSCKSLTIDHLNIKKINKQKDYYSNKFYNQNSLEKSLLSTRKRQALKILARLSNLSNQDTELIDYGCGKGIFLKEASLLGYKKLVGVESSKKSLKNLCSIFEMIKVEFRENNIIFKPNPKNLNNSHLRVLVALDVLEHFSKENIINWLEIILKEFSRPKYLIIKVPSREGILFKMAYFFTKLNITKKPLHQLLQVGTFPPHFFYFSAKGLINLFRDQNYHPIYITSDLDYEINSFSSRLNVKGPLKIIFNIFITLIALFSKIYHFEDSKIIFFKDTN